VLSLQESRGWFLWRLKKFHPRGLNSGRRCASCQFCRAWFEAWWKRF
jgi:hypothetical protein